jgi:hypothetical protein
MTNNSSGPRRRAVAADFVHHSLCCAHHVPEHAISAVRARPAVERHIVAPVGKQAVGGRWVGVVRDRPAKKMHLLVMKAHIYTLTLRVPIHSNRSGLGGPKDRIVNGHDTLGNVLAV